MLKTWRQTPQSNAPRSIGVSAGHGSSEWVSLWSHLICQKTPSQSRREGDCSPRVVAGCAGVEPKDHKQCVRVIPGKRDVVGIGSVLTSRSRAPRWPAHRAGNASESSGTRRGRSAPGRQWQGHRPNRRACRTVRRRQQPLAMPERYRLLAMGDRSTPPAACGGCPRWLCSPQ